MQDRTERHKELHQALDELLACYFVTTKRLISGTTLMDFLKWSHLMTEEAACPSHDGKHPEAVDFEAIFRDLAGLLDAIEAAVDQCEYERAQELIAGRFDMVRKHGLTVEVTGMPASGSTQ